MSSTKSNNVMLVRVDRYFKENPRTLTVVASRELGISEAEVLRHMPGDDVTELDADRFAEMMKRLERFGKIHVIVSNSVATLEVFGQVGNFSIWGEYFNIQTQSLDMHIRHKKIESVFAVEKPSHMDGVPTLSIQFYDEFGDSAFKSFLTFGSKTPSAMVRAYWVDFRNLFARA